MPCSRAKVPDEVNIPFLGRVDKGKLILAGTAAGSGLIAIEPLFKGNKND
jgi:hypothetical protein